MYYYAISMGFLAVIFDLVNGQATSGVLNGQYYLCLPTGTVCPTAGAPTIDPRIVTPTATASPCPAGTTPCFGRNVACGTRLITPTLTAPGPASPGAYPWQAYLRNATHSFAGSGVLISPYYVLTAAHKVYLNQYTPTAITVYMGVQIPSDILNIQSSNVQSSTVASMGVKLHPLFNATTLVNDIAVLQLSQPIVIGIYNNINTICLPAAGTTGAAYVGQTCSVSGWGQTSFTTFDAPTNPQKQVFVSIVNDDTCRASFANLQLDKYLDPNGEICAGGAAMLDACTQDGGSPLVCAPSGAFTLVGLVIWGKNCAQPGVYGVYVNVPYYLTWIQSQVTAAG